MAACHYPCNFVQVLKFAIGCRATLHLEVAKGDMADDLLVKVWQIHHAVVIIPHQTLNAKLGGVS